MASNIADCTIRIRIGCESHRASAALSELAQLADDIERAGLLGGLGEQLSHIVGDLKTAVVTEPTIEEESRGNVVFGCAPKAESLIKLYGTGFRGQIGWIEDGVDHHVNICEFLFGEIF